MNIFIGVSNDVNAITVKLQWNRPTNFALGLCKSERDLMLHADFAYTFDERKGMWVWVIVIFARKEIKLNSSHLNSLS
ncbi:hypothetical protein vBKpnAMK6_00421 [Klebsiella phage vB_Kpn_AM_K6]